MPAKPDLREMKAELERQDRAFEAVFAELATCDHEAPIHVSEDWLREVAEPPAPQQAPALPWTARA